MDVVKQHAKTIAAFVVSVLGNMLVSLADGEAPWPQTSGEWIRYTVTSFGAALAVYGTPNKITQKQIDRQPDIVGAVVVPAIARQASKAAQDTVADVAANLPKPARDAVQDLSNQVGSVVDQAIRDFQQRVRRP